MLKVIYITLCLFLVSCVNNAEEIKFANNFKEHSSLIKGERWEFKVPDTWKSVVKSDNTILVGYGLNSNKVFLTKEPFNGSLKEYAFGVKELLTNKGEHIIYCIQYTINNQDFYLLVGDAGTQNIWSWLTIKDNVAYGLTCGGNVSESSADVLTETCGEISKSFKFNDHSN